MKIISTLQKNTMAWWVHVSLCTVLFLSIGWYAYNETRSVLFGFGVNAQIEKSSTSSIANIVGTAKNASLLTLNGREISVDKNGNFDEKVTLLPGLSVITVYAQDKFGKTSEKNFEVVYKENNQVALVNKQ
jgi:hypothetical protein